MARRKRRAVELTACSIADAAQIIHRALEATEPQETSGKPLAKAQAGIRDVVRPSHSLWVGNHHGRRFGSIQFESPPEHDFLDRVEIEPEYEALVRQPVLVEWQDGQGRRRHHIPDFAARRSGLVTIIEIKTEEEKDQRDIRERTDILRLEFENYDIAYEVLTERWYRSEPEITNARRLALGRPFRPSQQDADDVAAYLAASGPADAWTIAEALKRQDQFAYAVYALCIDGFLKLANPACSIDECGRFIKA